MNPVCLDLGFIEIKWYSIFILIAFIVGYILVVNRSKKHEVPITFISDLGFYLVIFCIIGARLYYCLFNLDYYSKNLLDIFKIWEGGLAIHGGILAGFLTIYFFCKKKEFSLLKILDIFAPALVLGQAIGRWGNFFNSEAFGLPTNLPWKLYIAPQYRQVPYNNYDYFHPTFLYESILDFIIFLILFKLIKPNKHKTGNIALIYLILYSIVRIFVEHFRIDSVCYINGISIAIVVSAIIIVLAFLSILYNNFIKGKQS